jgi:transposase-like protein
MKKGKISFEKKLQAVGEVLIGKETLEVIAERFGMSSSYLSTLANRAKRAILPQLLRGEAAPGPEGLSISKEQLQDLARVKEIIVELEKKIRAEE